MRLWRTFLTIKPQRPLRARRKPLNMENPIVPALVLKAAKRPSPAPVVIWPGKLFVLKLKTSAVSVPSAVNIKDLFTAEGAKGATYSMFWICSRICSINTFKSTAAAVMSALMDLEARVLASRLNSCIMKSRRRPHGPPFLRILRASST